MPLSSTFSVDNQYEQTSTTAVGSAAGDNFVLHERARRHHWSGVASLSVKTFSGGRALYESEGTHVVDDGRYLILNHNQPYTITVDSDLPVESFCVFFAPGYVEDIFRTLVVHPEPLLDEPFPAEAAPVRFFAHTHRHDDLLSPALATIRQSSKDQPPEAGWAGEYFYPLALALLQAHRNVYRRLEQLPAARPATREELYRRLHLARDYMAATYSGPITLEEIARVAALSPNHLIRTFKPLFGRTPYQYVNHLRLEAACRLLRETERPVTDICFAVGFRSLGSFSARFTKIHGLSPSAFRRQRR